MDKVEKLEPRAFTRFCMSIAQVPSSYIAGLTIEEQLLWFCSYLENEVIPVVNNNGGAVEELQTLYLQLKDYVDNYFDNLDIQQEVNNKLDEMALSGELAEIIGQYIQLNGVLAYDTKAEMKAAENLVDGSVAKTLGTSSYDDGLGYIYKVREILNTDVIDDENIIALHDPDLIAERIANYITNDKTNPIYYGADPTGTNDSSTAINNCILANKGGTINFSQGTYKVNQVIELPYLQSEKVNINGNGAKLVNTVNLDRLIYVGSDKGENGYNDVGYPSYIKDLNIDGSSASTTYAIDIMKGYKDLRVINCTLFRFTNGIRIGESTGSPADVLVEGCLIYGKGSEVNGTGIIVNCSDNNINSTRIYGFRKGFVINSFVTIKETQVLLRWTNQTSANFDPYARNGEEWNSIYPLTMYAEVNAGARFDNCYGDSTYKFIELKTNEPVISNGLFFYNARHNVDNRVIDITVTDPKFILDNSEFNIGKNTEGVVIKTSETLTNYTQMKLGNTTIQNISYLSDPSDLILSTQPQLITNKTGAQNVWLLVKIIDNNSSYNNIKGILTINGYDYHIRLAGGANQEITGITQSLKSSTATNYTIGTFQKDGNIYVCLKTSASGGTGNVKFDWKTTWCANVVYDVTPVKNNSVAQSSRTLSDYTNLEPSQTLGLYSTL